MYLGSENVMKGDIRKILQLGEPGLRQIAQPINSVVEDFVAQTIADLKTTLAETAGVGLAAPQIDVSLQVIIVASKPTTRYPNAPLMSPVVMINPEMEVVHPHQEKDWEGCLSIPGIRARVPRYTHIRVQYLDEKGQPCQQELKDFPARVFQHEFDHLQGLVYLDQVENNRDIIAKAVYLRQVNRNTPSQPSAAKGEWSD
jgi:peptide deformylase